MSTEIRIFYDSMHFDEVAIEFQKSLGDLRVQTVYVLDSESEKKNWPRSIYFCFGLHKWFDLRNLPPRFVVMQFEPLSIRGYQSENYIIICKKAMAIFDYSKLNINTYKEYNIPMSKVFQVRVGLGKALHDFSDKLDPLATTFTTLPATNNKDLDVLFIGQITKYRLGILQSLKKRFPARNIQYFDNVWGLVRDNLVRRSRVVLNIHSEKSDHFPLETPRLLYFAPFDVHIVSEYSGDKDEDARWAARVIFCGPEFDILHSIFENEQTFAEKIHPANVCRFVHRFDHFIKKFNIEPSTVVGGGCPDIYTHAPAVNRKWFDTECNMFETLELDHPSVPDIASFPDHLLPCVSILTLTTLDRIEKWKHLMLWNNKHRVYDARKLEWIIVVEKPTQAEAKKFKKTQTEMLSAFALTPVFLFYENKHREIYHQITEKRNLGLQNCTYDYIDLMDDDDIEVPDALRNKMVLLDHYENKTCVGSRNLLCIDVTYPSSSSSLSLYVKKSFFPTESTLTFHKSFAAGVGFTPSIHGEGSLMVLGNPEKVIDIPSALNIIAVTHSRNVTGGSRSFVSPTDTNGSTTMSSSSSLIAQSSKTGQSVREGCATILSVTQQLRRFLGAGPADSLVHILFA